MKFSGLADCTTKPLHEEAQEQGKNEEPTEESKSSNKEVWEISDKWVVN